MTGEWLDFHDLIVEPENWGERASRFSIRPTRRIRFEEHSPLPLLGRHLFHEGFVSVGVSVPR
jgi:hypothetical protein